MATICHPQYGRKPKIAVYQRDGKPVPYKNSSKIHLLDRYSYYLGILASSALTAFATSFEDAKSES